jgi:hypothetical protein
VPVVGVSIIGLWCRGIGGILLLLAAQEVTPKVHSY